NKTKITEVNGKVIEHKNGFRVLPTFHPAMSLRDPRYWDRIHADLRRFGKIVNGEKLTQHHLNYLRVTRESQLEEVLSSIRRARVVAFALETNGLQPRLKTSKIGQTVTATLRQVFVIEHEEFDHKTLK